MQKPRKFPTDLIHELVEWHGKGVQITLLVDAIDIFDAMNEEKWQAFINWMGIKTKRFQTKYKKYNQSPQPIQYYLSRPNIAYEEEDYADDGWIYRQVNNGPVQCWALFDCEISRSYQNRKFLIKNVGSKKDVEENYDLDFPARDSNMQPISRKEAARIMRRWRRLYQKMG